MQREFLRLGKGLDAALVSLDLAVLLWEQGRTDELKEIAAEMMMAFESREVHREAPLAALALFQRACAEERGHGRYDPPRRLRLRRSFQASATTGAPDLTQPT